MMLVIVLTATIIGALIILGFCFIDWNETIMNNREKDLEINRLRNLLWEHGISPESGYDTVLLQHLDIRLGDDDLYKLIGDNNNDDESDIR